MVLIDYDLIDMIFLITVMHVFALDTVNSNLLFGISSVAVLVAEHQIKRYPIVKKSYVSHSVRFPPPSPPFLEEGWEWGWVGFHGIFTMCYLLGVSHHEI